MMKRTGFFPGKISRICLSCIDMREKRASGGRDTVMWRIDYLLSPKKGESFDVSSLARTEGLI
jgi:hypothetical protein